MYLFLHLGGRVEISFGHGFYINSTKLMLELCNTDTSRVIISICCMQLFFVHHICCIFGVLGCIILLYVVFSGL